MNPLPLAPLLAIEFGQILGLLVLLFSVLSWVVGAVKQARSNWDSRSRPQGNSTPRPKPRKDLSQQVDAFLKDIVDKNSNESQIRAAQEREALRQREREEEQRRRSANQAAVRENRKNRGNNRKSSQADRDAANQMSRPIAQAVQAFDSTGLGAFDTGPGAVSQSVQKHFANDVDQQVARDLGSTAATRGMPSISETSNAAAQSVLALMKSPTGIRDAIVINEILQRPRALRK